MLWAPPPQDETVFLSYKDSNTELQFLILKRDSQTSFKHFNSIWRRHFLQFKYQDPVSEGWGCGYPKTPQVFTAVEGQLFIHLHVAFYLEVFPASLYHRISQERNIKTVCVIGNTDLLLHTVDFQPFFRDVYTHTSSLRLSAAKVQQEGKKGPTLALQEVHIHTSPWTSQNLTPFP